LRAPFVTAAYNICTKDDTQNDLCGGVYAVNARRFLVQSSGKTVVVLGLDDVVIVETSDALLVCRRDRVQDVHTLVEQLEKQGRAELL
jgi:Mannose-6-phosphate isomerase